MAGRRDRAEQRHRVRDADELGCPAGPPGTGSDPPPHSSRAGAWTPGSARCPPWSGAGLRPCPSSGSAPPARRQRCLHWGRGEVSSPVSGKWEEGHVFTCCPCKGRAALPEIRGSSLQAGHTTARHTIRSGDQGHGTWWWGVEKAGEGLEVRVMTWEELQQPPAPVQWKESAATTI